MHILVRIALLIALVLLFALISGITRELASDGKLPWISTVVVMAVFGGLAALIVTYKRVGGPTPQPTTPPEEKHANEVPGRNLAPLLFLAFGAGIVAGLVVAAGIGDGQQADRSTNDSPDLVTRQQPRQETADTNRSPGQYGYLRNLCSGKAGIELGRCLTDAQARANDILDSLYRRAQQRMRSESVRSAEYGPRIPAEKWSATMAASHEAWAEFREISCDLVYYETWLGSGTGNFIQICGLNMTIERLEDISAFIENSGSAKHPRHYPDYY